MLILTRSSSFLQTFQIYTVLGNSENLKEVKWNKPDKREFMQTHNMWVEIYLRITCCVNAKGISPIGSQRAEKMSNNW